MVAKGVAESRARGGVEGGGSEGSESFETSRGRTAFFRQLIVSEDKACVLRELPSVF